MSKKMIKLTAIIIAVIFLLGIIVPLSYTFVFSVPASDDAELSSIREKKKVTLDDISRLEIELNASEEKVRELNEKISESAGELEAIDERLLAAEELEKKYNEESGTRFRVMCEKGMMSYLDIIFSATSFTDFTDRIVIAKELAEYDKKVMDAMKSVKAEISEDKKSAEEILEQQQKSMDGLITAKADLEKKQAESKAAYDRLLSDEKAYIEYIERKEAEENSLRKTYASQGVVAVSDVQQGMFIWPTDTTYVTSNFSPDRVNPVSGKVLPHTGTDIGAQSGAPALSSAEGTVSFAGENGGYGNCVIINHGGGVSTLYGHMSAVLVNSGDTVAQGDLIGRVGSTGNSTGPHLHFEILLGGTPVDPMQFF